MEKNCSNQILKEQKENLPNLLELSRRLSNMKNSKKIALIISKQRLKSYSYSGESVKLLSGDITTLFNRTTSD